MASPETTILLRRAKQGDADSMATLIQRLSPLLAAQARYRLGSTTPDVDPEDIVQDVWTRALPKLPDLSERDGRQTPVLLKFLATTLLYRVQEVFRSRIRRRQSGQTRETSSDPGVEPRLAPETVGVVSRVVRAERRDKLWEVLEGLDPADREILILRGIEQQDNSAVAERLGATPNAVSLRYNRILTRLRDRLSGSVLDEL